ncbi:hypothetical protein DSM106972_041250 [Dulcicalothrix desertica PCC 7102]|uniref:DUF4351 domain-containing protein n=1 Tax=Dulcicalothrix desertica PCC 7102 TaxID=232991 RepID=A0A3S1CNK7_9CYAN|nr:DUF4351 domain-containing protein [Dulcicalothrix desertica]RUT05304.1 hypothetical protein DSM106972_041250 [Dulcicalothrix desertica PCC 7102]TWH43199.1 putative transposase/invertase (TIGR01784 family) [Dulcicalothrix desertica PCC 7102]
MSYDNVCKLLAEKYPLEFVRWLLPTRAKKVTVLKTELSIEPIRADSVIFLQAGNRILHIEFQTLTISDPPIPFRELDYSVRIKRQYNLPVTQVVIFLQETDDEIAKTDEYRDETTVHKYQVIRMWEQDPRLFLNNTALLPLAPLAQTSTPEALLSQVAQKIATISNKGERQDTAGYTEILAGLRFDKNLIRNLLSEDIMKESVIYQDILQQGRQQGKQQEAFELIRLLLNQRFQKVDALLIEKIRAFPTEQLEKLAVAFLNFQKVSDLETWLNQQ